LADGDDGRKTDNSFDGWLFELRYEASGPGRERFEQEALAFGVEGIEGERGFAGAAESGDDNELVARNIYGDMLEVMFVSAFDSDSLSHEDTPYDSDVSEQCNW